MYDIVGIFREIKLSEARPKTSTNRNQDFFISKTQNQEPPRPERPYDLGKYQRIYQIHVVCTSNVEPHGKEVPRPRKAPALKLKGRYNNNMSRKVCTRMQTRNTSTERAPT